VATPFKASEAQREKNRVAVAKYRADHTEEARARAAAWRSANPERVAFNDHKNGAKKRGIPFLFTFDEWVAIWRNSGKSDQRGPWKGQYVMARFGDKGGYEPGNVKIVTNGENSAERNRLHRSPHGGSLVGKERKQAWYLANREESIERSAKWAKDNRDRNNDRRRKAYAATHGAGPSHI